MPVAGAPVAAHVELGAVRTHSVLAATALLLKSWVCAGGMLEGLVALVAGGLMMAVAAGSALADEPTWKLGGHFPDELPPLSAEELSQPSMQALWLALAGEPYAHRVDDHVRSGCAMQVRPRAIPSETRHYGGYRVGGGVPLRGAPLGPEEGTFGWDYFGLILPKRVALRQSVPPRWQGGAGQYRTTGARWPSHE